MSNMNPAAGTRAITLSVTVKASPERVYKALTDAQELMKWFPTVVETDPRPGGTYKFTWKSKDQSRDHIREGKFVELVPGKKVSYTWDARPMKDLSVSTGKSLPTMVEWTLEKTADGTKVTLVHSGWGVGPEWEEMFAQHDGGWNVFTRNLKSVIEDGVDIREKQFEMRTA